MCGIAIATMAMICVMSVYNGFRDFLGNRMENLVPDVEIRAAEGNLIENADSLALELESLSSVELATPVIDENMLIYHGNYMLPVRTLGVDPNVFPKVTDLNSLAGNDGGYKLGFYDEGLGEESSTEDEKMEEENDVVAGMDFDENDLYISAADLYSDDSEMTDLTSSSESQYILLSADIFSQLYGDNNMVVDEMEGPTTLIVPRRTGYISTANPEGAFQASNIKAGGILSTDKTTLGSNVIVAGLQLARDLLEYDSQGNSIYVKAATGVNESQLAKIIRDKIGPNYNVIDRNSQVSLHFNMMRIEKWITFFLLAFILLIASFNIISTMSMLIVEKRRSIRLMRNLGASNSLVGEIFCWESFYVCIGGTIIGLGLGLFLCWLQIKFGLIGIPNASENLIIDRYPVAIEVSDLAWVMVPSLLIALITAVISSRFARRSAASFHD